MILKIEKIYYCEKMTLLDRQIMKKIENDEHSIIGIVQLDGVKEQELKEQFIKEYRRRL